MENLIKQYLEGRSQPGMWDYGGPLDIHREVICHGLDVASASLSNKTSATFFQWLVPINAFPGRFDSNLQRSKNISQPIFINNVLLSLVTLWGNFFEAAGGFFEIFFFLVMQDN